MKRFKIFSLWFSVFVFAFLFAYQPMLVRAQSIEDLHGIHESIGGNETVASDNGDDNFTTYLIAGAVVVGIALYFYLKWAEKKRPSHKNKKAELKTEKKLTLSEKQSDEKPAVPKREKLLLQTK